MQKDEKAPKLIETLTKDPKWAYWLTDVRKEKIEGILLDKLNEYSEQGRADKYINDMFIQLDLIKKKWYELAPQDFLYVHNILELDHQKIWKYMNYKELRAIIKGIKEIKENSPYYKLIKHIHIPYKYTLNIAMINDLRYDLVLRLEDVGPTNKKNALKNYENILVRTMEETDNPVLKSKLKLWHQFMTQSDLEEMLEGD